MLDEVAVGDLAQAVPAGETATVGAGQARGRPLRRTGEHLRAHYDPVGPSGNIGLPACAPPGFLV